MMASVPHAFWLVVFLFCCLNVQALIPEECTGNVTRPGKVCCPPSPENGLVCGGPSRGYCQKIYAPHEDVPYLLQVDDRLQWPMKFIHRACQCQPRFFGVSCERCWFGWTGPNCDRREHKIRKEIRNLSPKELYIYKDVVRRSFSWPSGYSVVHEAKTTDADPAMRPTFKSATVQYYITFLHYYGARHTLFDDEGLCSDLSILNFNHDGVVFPTWHRYYSLIWERMLADIAWEVHRVKDFTLPYWDWVGAKQCTICTNKYIGATGAIDEYGLRLDPNSPFYNLTDFCWEEVKGLVCIACHTAGRFGKITRYFKDTEFPNQDDIEFTLSRRKYFVLGERDNPKCESFHMALEGFCGIPQKANSRLWTHNRLHNMIQGSMDSLATAANDPMFALHHNFMDKLFTMWYRMRQPQLEDYPNEGVRPGHSRDAFMIGIFPLARNGDMFTDPNALGYDYDDPDSVGHFAENGRPPVYVDQIH